MTVREVGLPGGVGDELAAVGAALERFVSRPRGDRPEEVVRDEMVGWRRLLDRMELEFSGIGGYGSSTGSPSLVLVTRDRSGPAWAGNRSRNRSMAWATEWMLPPKWGMTSNIPLAPR
jgi:hypothetical protein